LEYLGRQDFQVKIRGQRIETQEIETYLLGLEAVQEAVVVGGVDGQGEAYLVAYIVPTRYPPPRVAVLRHHLAQTLPAAMIPARFIFLDTLPLLPGGKVDRRALPAPSRARPNLSVPVTPPSTPIEEALVAIWAEVLGVDTLSIHDPFLELGGDSLLAMQVIARVRTRFQVQLPEHVLFEAPTVADMALVILQNQTEHMDAETLESLLGEC
jgi:acyl carrier protein